jgi:hypothetical protein
VDRAIASQIALYGDGNQEIDDAKQPRAQRVEVRQTPPYPGTLRWYWTEYQKSDQWLGNLSVGEKGLRPSTRHQRVLFHARDQIENFAMLPGKESGNERVTFLGSRAKKS